MARVFNLGLGMLAVVPNDAVEAAQDALAERGGSYVVGRVVSGESTLTLT
jgi:phosphoribosylaminoimidazole (AIR) synthetase